MSVEYPGELVEYTIDAVGNRRGERTSTLGGGGPPVLTSNKTFTFDNRHRLQLIVDSVDSSNNASWTFDAAGNQTSRTRDGVTSEFTWDGRNRLLEVGEGGTLVERYGYDHLDRRVSRAGSGEVVRYLWDEESILEVHDGAGLLLQKYEYGPDRLLSLWDATAPVAEARQFQLFDGLGSITALVRGDGLVQARRLWDAWGVSRGEVGETSNRFGFTGHEHDEATGLIYAKARYLDPELGRFLSEDPFAGVDNEPPSLHRYLYGYANPTVYWDPDGRIGILTTFSNWLEGGSTENAGDLAGAVQEEYGGVAGAVVGVVAGAASAATTAVKGVVDVANTVVNVAVARTAPDTEIGREADRELSELTDKVVATTQAIAENPVGVGTAVVKAVSDTAGGVLQGDARSIASASAAVTEFVASGGARTVANVTMGGARVARRGAGAVADAVSDAVRSRRRSTGLMEAPDRQVASPAAALGGDAPEPPPHRTFEPGPFAGESRHGDFHGPWREAPSEDFRWKRYFERETGTVAPAGMYDPHAHHIMMKKGQPGMAKLIEEGHSILRLRAGIDPIWDVRNMTWAPNRVPGQHSAETLEGIVSHLRALDQANASPEAFLEALRKLGAEAAARAPH